jgi:hypothetical protein
VVTSLLLCCGMAGILFADRERDWVSIDTYRLLAAPPRLMLS